MSEDTKIRENDLIRFKYNRATHQGQSRCVFVQDMTENPRNHTVMVSGYCFLAREYRNFFIDEMKEVEILDLNDIEVVPVDSMRREPVEPKIDPETIELILLIIKLLMQLRK